MVTSIISAVFCLLLVIIAIVHTKASLYMHFFGRGVLGKFIFLVQYNPNFCKCVKTTFDRKVAIRLH